MITRNAKFPPIIITAKRAELADVQCILDVLETGINPTIVTPEQVHGTLLDGSHSFLLYQNNELLGIVELRAIHPEPERSNAVVVIWLVKREPIGIGVVALGFIFRYAFYTLGLREVWGWVRQDNSPMLKLCKHLGLTDNGTWEGDPEFRLITFIKQDFENIEKISSKLKKRIIINLI